MLKIDYNLYQKINEIKQILSPFTSRAYLVGGCARDIFLNCHKFADLDIEIYDILPDDFDVLMQSINAKIVGKNFFIYKFKNYDLGIPRTENKKGNRHTDFDVFYCNDEKTACIRRDFTINSLMINIFNLELLDFWQGLKDIHLKKIKHIDDEKFCEDPLRVLRALQFSSRFKFKIDKKTLSLMKHLSLENLSLSRISAELIKFFNAKFIDFSVFYFYELGLLKKLLGLDINKTDYLKFIKIFKRHFKFVKDERLFLYVFCGYFKLNQKDIAIKLGLGRKFYNNERQKFYIRKPSDFELLKIAIKFPIKDFLGLNKKIIKRAKKFGIFDKKFKINFKELENSQLNSKDLKHKINKIQEKAIRYKIMTNFN